MENATLKGTTTIGLVCKDGIIFAADKRATMGYLIANKDAQKIYQIDDKMAITTAGSVGDAQTLVRWIKSEIALYKQRGNITVKGVTTLLSNILSSSKYYPYLVQLLVGGVDKSPKIYALDPIGGVTEEKATSTGSGSPIAYGVLETQFKENRTVEENIPLVLSALGAAISRDCASGDGVDLVTITQSGFKRYTPEEIKILKK